MPNFLKDRKEVSLLYATAKAFGQRPSDIIGIRNRWAAYDFDVAVLATGIEIENEAHEAVKEKARSGGAAPPMSKGRGVPPLGNLPPRLPALPPGKR